MLCFFCFKQKTAYEMRISDWSSDVCSSDLVRAVVGGMPALRDARCARIPVARGRHHELRSRGRNQARRPIAGRNEQIRYTVSMPNWSARSEQRRVGHKCVRKCSSRWVPSLYKKRDIELSEKPLNTRT